MLVLVVVVFVVLIGVSLVVSIYSTSIGSNDRGVISVSIYSSIICSNDRGVNL